MTLKIFNTVGKIQEEPLIFFNFSEFVNENDLLGNEISISVSEKILFQPHQ